MSTSRSQNYLNRPAEEIAQDLRGLVDDYHQKKASVAALITTTLQGLWSKDIDWGKAKEDQQNLPVPDRVIDCLQGIIDHPNTPQEIKALKPQLVAVLKNTFTQRLDSYKAAMKIIAQQATRTLFNIEKTAPHQPKDLVIQLDWVMRQDQLATNTDDDRNLHDSFQQLAIMYAKNYYHVLDALHLDETQLSFQSYMQQQAQTTFPWSPIAVADEANLKIKINAIFETLKQAKPIRDIDDIEYNNRWGRPQKIVRYGSGEDDWQYTSEQLQSYEEPIYYEDEQGNVCIAEEEGPPNNNVNIIFFNFVQVYYAKKIAATRELSYLPSLVENLIQDAHYFRKKVFANKNHPVTKLLDHVIANKQATTRQLHHIRLQLLRQLHHGNPYNTHLAKTIQKTLTENKTEIADFNAKRDQDLARKKADDEAIEQEPRHYYSIAALYIYADYFTKDICETLGINHDIIGKAKAMSAEDAFTYLNKELDKTEGIDKKIKEKTKKNHRQFYQCHDEARGNDYLKFYYVKELKNVTDGNQIQRLFDKKEVGVLMRPKELSIGYVDELLQSLDNGNPLEVNIIKLIKDFLIKSIDVIIALEEKNQESDRLSPSLSEAEAAQHIFSTITAYILISPAKASLHAAGVNAFLQVLDIVMLREINEIAKTYIKDSKLKNKEALKGYLAKNIDRLLSPEDNQFEEKLIVQLRNSQVSFHHALPYLKNLSTKAIHQLLIPPKDLAIKYDLANLADDVSIFARPGNSRYQAPPVDNIDYTKEIENLFHHGGPLKLFSSAGEEASYKSVFIYLKYVLQPRLAKLAPQTTDHKEQIQEALAAANELLDPQKTPELTTEAIMSLIERANVDNILGELAAPGAIAIQVHIHDIGKHLKKNNHYVAHIFQQRNIPAQNKAHAEYKFKASLLKDFWHKNIKKLPLKRIKNNSKILSVDIGEYLAQAMKTYCQTAQGENNLEKDLLKHFKDFFAELHKTKNDVENITDKQLLRFYELYLHIQESKSKDKADKHAAQFMEKVVTHYARKNTLDTVDIKALNEFSRDLRQSKPQSYAEDGPTITYVDLTPPADDEETPTPTEFNTGANNIYQKLTQLATTQNYRGNFNRNAIKALEILDMHTSDSDVDDDVNKCHLIGRLMTERATRVHDSFSRMLNRNGEKEFYCALTLLMDATAGDYQQRISIVNKIIAGSTKDLYNEVANLLVNAAIAKGETLSEKTITDAVKAIAPRIKKITLPTDWSMAPLANELSGTYEEQAKSCSSRFFCSGSSKRIKSDAPQGMANILFILRSKMLTFEQKKTLLQVLADNADKYPEIQATFRAVEGVFNGIGDADTQPALTKPGNQINPAYTVQIDFQKVLSESESDNQPATLCNFLPKITAAPRPTH
jgi:hypothetical protein